MRHRLPDAGFRLTYCHNATLGRRDFYQQLCHALGLSPKATAAADFHEASTHVQRTRALILPKNQGCPSPHKIRGYLGHKSGGPPGTVVIGRAGSTRDSISIAAGAGARATGSQAMNGQDVGTGGRGGRSWCRAMAPDFLNYDKLIPMDIY